ncbi:hypothetical protein Peur_018639 [Populus x canadensis]
MSTSSSSPCNGIICFYRDWDGITLWNPAIRESKVLQIYCKWFFVGYGFDSEVNDYKIMGFTGAWNSTRIISYGLSSDNWMEIPDDRSLRPRDLLDLLLQDKKGRTVNISFDTSNELFGVGTAWEDILASTKMRVYICTLE